MKTYENYHTHKDGSNVYVPDTPMMFSDYLKRTEELGHNSISSIEHGWVGNYFSDYLQLEKHNKKREKEGKSPLKWIYGGEFYWVKDRKTKDDANCHIIILARNENGRKNINRIMSECNKTGYYKRPRLDLELIYSLPKDDVFITTACVAGWKYEDSEQIFIDMNNYFNHFYLEVQAHNTLKQKELNKKILKLSKSEGIKIIAGVDSHIIDNSQIEERDDFLRSNGVVYEDEEGWDLDFPDYETLFSRFQKQGILSDEEIEIALENTKDVLKFEDIILDKTMKIPTLYPKLNQEERDNKFKQLINEKWIKERDNIPKEKHKHYIEEIRKEVNEIIGCGMSDYFMLNEAIIRRGIEKYNGVLTKTGRGSGCSEYINKLLGFTNVDRINSKVTMYPERFLTKERILESATPPDIDHNLEAREPFIQAQKDLLGEKSTYDLIAFGTLKFKSAWKMYAKAYKVTPSDADIVSKQITKYEEKLKYAERDEETGELIEEVDIFDFVDIKYKPLIEGCKKYLGIKTTRKGHPCGSIASSLNVEEEIGVILCKSESTKKETLTACIESGLIDYFGWLKNDFLIVSVVSTTKKVYDRIGIKPHSMNELLELIENDKKTWDIYKNGYTLCVNQVEKPGTRKKTMEYAPTNIVELCALIAAVRPSFKTLVKKFISREDFHYGIPELDNLLQTPEMPYSYIFYQEQLMQILGFSGFEIKDTYDIIKSISKKKTYCRDCENTGNDSMHTCPRCGSKNIAPLVEKFKEQFVQGFSNKIKSASNKEQIAHDVWEIVLSFAAYGFNSSHSYCMALDSVNQAYLKAHYPLEFYEVMLKTYTKKGEKDKVKDLKEEMKNFNIKLGDIKFGEDNRDFTMNKEARLITQSLVSIKGFSQVTADKIYEISKIREYENFIDLLSEIKNHKELQSNHIADLINIGYFEEYGNREYLHYCVKIFNKFYFAKQITKGTEYDSVIEKYSRSTEKQFRDLDNKKIIDEILSYEDPTVTILEKIITDYKKFGECLLKDESENKSKYIVINIDETHSPKLWLHNIKTGRSGEVKISKKLFSQRPAKEDDILILLDYKEKNKGYYEGKTWVKIPDKFDIWLEDYIICK